MAPAVGSRYIANIEHLDDGRHKCGPYDGGFNIWTRKKAKRYRVCYVYIVYCTLGMLAKLPFRTLQWSTFILFSFITEHSPSWMSRTCSSLPAWGMRF